MRSPQDTPGFLRGAMVIVQKELLELRRSPVLLLSMISLPVTVVAMPIGLYAWLTHAAPDQAVDFLRDLYGISPQGGKAAALAALLAKNWLPMFLVLPIFLPILIAAQSVGGERERRTLEPLLATPVTTLEIILGKSVAAVLPSVLITWVAAAIFCGGINFLAWPHLLPGAHLPLPDPNWLFANLVLSPLLALLGNSLAVVLGSVVADPRAAQNLAGMTVVPLLGALVAQLAGRISLGWTFYAALSVTTLVADVVLIALAARLFDREKLLTRWR
jgi:ABC-2 type transport system permease protein